ncbi:ROK family protein [Haloarchaeobius sp. DYHT-AS-18]|uniref:ROK family protein n=1 Tax=Haloarchaeobius sp. DYHT-AS-18 TaxID=3446117 RepID=UPI003EBAABE1
MATYAGVDLGATNVRAVVGDDDARIIGSYRTKTPQGPTGIDVTEAVLDTLRRACADAGVEPTDVTAAGIGAAGPLDLAEGTLETPPNLPDTVERVPLSGPIGQLINSDRVHLHNDTNAGCIGQRFFADRNPDDMVYITISSGIGAGVCIDGNIASGWDGNAGEVGHYVVDPQGRLTCGCGMDGHWEAYCSGNNIPRFARLLAEDDPEFETDLPLDDPDFSAKDVFEHASDDEFANHVVDQVAHWNAIGVANVVHSFAPIVIYIGGAVALNNSELVMDPIRERVSEMVMTNVPDIQLTTLGDDVVVKGALASALTAGTGDRSKLRR